MKIKTFSETGRLHSVNSEHCNALDQNQSIAAFIHVHCSVNIVHRTMLLSHIFKFILSYFLELPWVVFRKVLLTEVKVRKVEGNGCAQTCVAFACATDAL